jgi:hypothetical protein
MLQDGTPNTRNDSHEKWPTQRGAVKGLAVVEIWRVNDVADSAEFIREGEAPGCQSLCVMEEQKLGPAGQASTGVRHRLGRFLRR